mgnify:CR=1 FL=1
MLQRRRLCLGLLAIPASLALLACDQKTDAPPAEAVPVTKAYDAVAAEGKGFSVGPITAARTVYVLFDPQCPHCGHLWNAAKPLLDRVRFVWMPVAFLSARSLPQGATLMQAAQPVEAMDAHEQSLLAGQGGTSASASVPDELRATIESNTRLLNRLGAESVPFIVARPSVGALPVTHAGALDTAELAQLIGLN